MKLAVIDCGTNTFNLLIVETLGGMDFRRLHSERVPVKLGESSINEGYISDVPYRRGLDAMKKFSETIAGNGEVKTMAYATSAIRDARNGNDFIDDVREKYGIEIKIIDGNKEAALIYLGIREAVKLSADISLIMDIGGGSTEFILANSSEMLWKGSFRIGAARLLARFQHSNPISEKEQEEISTYINEQLEPLYDAINKFRPSELIGSSGAFESFIEMFQEEFGGERLVPEKIGYILKKEHYEQVSGLVKGSTIEQRRLIKGLVPMRFDMIVICCVMVDTILRAANVSKIRVSTFSLKEGALIEYLAQNN